MRLIKRNPVFSAAQTVSKHRMGQLPVDFSVTDQNLGYYHCQQSLCTHYKHAVDRRERRSRLGSKPDSYNVRFLSDQERRKGMPVMVTQPRVPPVPERPALDQSPGPRPRLFDPSEIKFIEMACEDRPYKLIKGKEGEMVSMHGALIPERYDLDDTVPTYPWICPVRSCRVVFKKIANLGSHFVVSFGSRKLVVKIPNY